MLHHPAWKMIGLNIVPSGRWPIRQSRRGPPCLSQSPNPVPKSTQKYDLLGSAWALQAHDFTYFWGPGKDLHRTRPTPQELPPGSKDSCSKAFGPKHHVIEGFRKILSHRVQQGSLLLCRMGSPDQNLRVP